MKYILDTAPEGLLPVGMSIVMVVQRLYHTNALWCQSITCNCPQTRSGWTLTPCPLKCGRLKIEPDGKCPLESRLYYPFNLLHPYAELFEATNKLYHVQLPETIHRIYKMYDRFRKFRPK
jgi:hypothetical protein